MRSKSPVQADKILAAAAQLFATHRFHEARMEDIAAVAAVGKGTLYRYFKDKEELYLALLQRAAMALQQQLQESRHEADPPRVQLVAVVRGLIAHFDENPHLFDLIQHAEAMQKPDTEFPWQKTRRQTQVLIKEIFAAGKASGDFAIADPELAVLMLLGGLRSVYRFGALPRPADLAEQVVAGFLGGHAHCPAVRGAGLNGDTDRTHFAQAAC